MYKMFFLDESGEARRDTRFVFLNVYDNTGHWIGQYSWDGKAKTIRFGRKYEHY